MFVVVIWIVNFGQLARYPLVIPITPPLIFFALFVGDDFETGGEAVVRPYLCFNRCETISIASANRHDMLTLCRGFKF
ncbi:hypothetical protein [Bradyrhizobium sp.]|uniref:hypothetical protein n=1 Tax=Bradyrhizobium sp. TaxID=376 RepID=UPI0039E5FD84